MFDCQVQSFFAISFCSKRNCNSLKNASFLLILSCIGCLKQKEALWLIAALQRCLQLKKVSLSVHFPPFFVVLFDALFFI